MQDGMRCVTVAAAYRTDRLFHVKHDTQPVRAFGTLVKLRAERFAMPLSWEINGFGLEILVGLGLTSYRAQRRTGSAESRLCGPSVSFRVIPSASVEQSSLTTPKTRNLKRLYGVIPLVLLHKTAKHAIDIDGTYVCGRLPPRVAARSSVARRWILRPRAGASFHGNEGKMSTKPRMLLTLDSSSLHSSE